MSDLQWERRTPSFQALTDHPLQDVRRQRRALGRWLEGFEWDAWATLTFGAKWGLDGPSVERAFHHAGRWLEGLPHRPSYFLAVERGAQGGRAHCHALIGPGRHEVPRRAMWRGWFRRFGRAEFLPYGFDRQGVPVSGAEFYLTKYLTKAPLTWDLKR